jgi:hypothetical protein
MNELPPPSDAERELNDLRVRAYGRDHDIEADPAAFARLAELENARVADTAARPGVELLTPAADAGGTAAPASDAPGTAEPASDAWGTGPAASDADRPAPAGAAMDDARTPTSRGGYWRSLWRRATATRSRRIWFLAASSVVVAIVVYAVTWLDGPTPDATLRPLDGDDDGQLIQLMDDLGMANLSTLQEFEPYRGVEPWTVVHPDRGLCLVAVARARTEVFNAQCVPPGTELFVNLTIAPGVEFGPWRSFDDAYAEGLPDGSLIRFHLRDDAVDVFLYPASKAD